MKKTASFLMALIFVLFGSALAQTENNYPYSYARMTYVKGDVFVQRAEDLGYEEGTVNLALIEGDKLGTKFGRTEVHFGRKNFLRLDDNTEVELVALPREEDDRIKLHLLKGRVYLRVNFLDSEKTIEVHTPDASFYILEEGLYRLEIRENLETEFMAFEGSAEAAGEEGSLLVGSRERLVASSGRLGSQTALYFQGDAFARWNEDRDALHSQYVSRRYLPSELDEYEYELTSNGRWIYERPYGYVWVPYVYYTDWRPYYYGRWIWYPVCGWTWISSEPWGWCVYHYGRWHWRLGLGWYWIPTRYWGPAWVHWYRGYDYVGWCPLTYYNYPAVVINNYFYERYYHPHYPAHSRALTVVHKNQLQSRRLADVALSRTQAGNLGKINLEARQPDIKPVVNRAGLHNFSSVKSISPSSARGVVKSAVSTEKGTPLRIEQNSSRLSSRLSSGQSKVEEKSGFSTGNVSKSRGIASFPSSSSKGRISSSRRQVSSITPSIRTDSGTSRKVENSTYAARIKTYQPVSKSSSSGQRISNSRQESPKVYSSSPGITRPTATFKKYGALSSRVEKSFSGTSLYSFSGRRASPSRESTSRLSSKSSSLYSSSRASFSSSSPRRESSSTSRSLSGSSRISPSSRSSSGSRISSSSSSRSSSSSSSSGRSSSSRSSSGSVRKKSD